jgi:glycine dehydrogenase subunit 2
VRVRPGKRERDAGALPGSRLRRRVDVVRYSLERLKDETGIGTEEVRNRIVDYGLPGHWMSHHPVTTPEPFTLEPTESFDRRELDEVAAISERVVAEARAEPETVRTAPHRGPVARMRTDLVETDWPPRASWQLLEQEGRAGTETS